MVEGSLKCVAVGDQGTGKTQLLSVYSRNHFVPALYDPEALTDYEHCDVDGVTYGGIPYSLRLYDTDAHDQWSTLRRRIYANTDVFLICFSVVKPSSFRNISEKWLPEIVAECAKPRFFIVGTQTDLRSASSSEDGEGSCVSHEQGYELAKQLNAVKYLECSSLAHKGVKKIFDELVLAVMENRVGGQKKNSCCVQ